MLENKFLTILTKALIMLEGILIITKNQPGILRMMIS